MKAKKIIVTLLVAGFALSGIGFLLYPFIGFYLESRRESYAIQEYSEGLENIGSAEQQELWDRAVAYNSGLKMESANDPFTATPAEMDTDYAAQLRTDERGMMGYIEIPAADIRLPIFHGTSQKSLDNGAGHMEGTSLPVGGAGTHCVLTGHTGLSTAMLFTNLDKLDSGDEIYLSVLNRTLIYRVVDKEVIEPTETGWIVTGENRDLLTLLTCTPYGINSHRLLVKAERVLLSEQQAKARMENLPASQQHVYILIIAAAVLILLLVLIIRRKRKNYS